MRQKLKTLRSLAQLSGWPAVGRLMMARLRGSGSVHLPVPESSEAVRVRLNNSDLVIYLGTFLHGDCRIDAPLHPRMVLDLGANAGYTAIQLHRQFPGASLIAVEPGGDNYELCRENLRPYPQISCLRRVMSTSVGWFRLSNPWEIAMSQQYLPCAPDAPDAVEACSVADILNCVTAEQPVLVKLDIEGAERQIFLAGDEWLPRVHAVLVEPHGEGTAEVITAALARHGFEISAIGEKIFGHRPVAS